jgi:hypothetical protein
MIRFSLPLSLAVAGALFASPNAEPDLTGAGRLPRVTHFLGSSANRNVTLDRVLANRRVLWVDAQATPTATLRRLATLNGGYLREPETGSLELGLPRPLAAAEAQWTPTRLASAIDRLVRAALASEAGAPVPDSLARATAGSGGGLNGLAMLSALGPAQVAELVRTENVSIPMRSVNAERLEKLLHTRFSVEAADRNLPEEQLVSQARERLAQEGIGVQLDAQPEDRGLLRLSYRLGREPKRPLVLIREADLGDAQPRGNPYHVLLGQAQPVDQLPESFSTKTSVDLTVGDDGSWASTLPRIAALAAVPCYSDDYLFRSGSTLSGGRGAVLAAKGVALDQALDQACAKFGYLWWYDKGICYFHSRTWPYDQRAEVPGELLDNWKKELTRQQALSPSSLATAISLPPYQFRSLVRMPANAVTGHFMRASFETSLGRGFLQFYRGLPPVAQVQLNTDGLRLLPGRDPEWEVIRTAGASLGPEAPLVVHVLSKAERAAPADAFEWKVACSAGVVAVEHPGDTFSPFKFSFYLPKARDLPATEPATSK